MGSARGSQPPHPCWRRRDAAPTCTHRASQSRGGLGLGRAVHVCSPLRAAGPPAPQMMDSSSWKRTQTKRLPDLQRERWARRRRETGAKVDLRICWGSSHASRHRDGRAPAYLALTSGSPPFPLFILWLRQAQKPQNTASHRRLRASASAPPSTVPCIPIPWTPSAIGNAPPPCREALPTHSTPSPLACHPGSEPEGSVRHTVGAQQTLAG